MAKTADKSDLKKVERRRPGLMVVSAKNPIPKSYAGKYVAMLTDGRTIVAVDRTSTGVRRKAVKAGYPVVAVAWIPRGRTIG